MNAWRKAMVCAMALGLLSTKAALAQRGGGKQGGGQDKCNVESASSGQVKNAYSSVTLLQLGAAKPDDAKKRLTSAVKDLTSKPDFGKDQMARDYTLGAALVLWYDQLGEPASVKRGDVGYATNPEGSVDLLAAADSAFRTVESQEPSCVDKTQFFRERPWAKLVNQVPALINEDKLDSASKVLDRSLVIYRGSPYTYYFEGQLKQRKDDWQGAAQAYAKVAELAKPQEVAADSGLANVKEFSEFGAAYATLRSAQAMSGEQQKAEMKKAADMYRQYIKDYPNSANIEPAQAGLAAALQGTGDTAALASIWQEMLANPARYTDVQFFDAGTQAFSSDQIPMAVQLMEAGHKSNPYLRGGLFNLANAYWKAEEFDKMAAVCRQLLAVDPNNPDNYQLMAIAYQGLSKKATDAKAKKALSDSTLKYVTDADKLPVKVTFTYGRDGATTKLNGEVEDLGTTPTNGTLKVEFLDKGGNVVTTQTVPLALKPKEKKPVELSVEGQSIVAYRYAIIK
jgi:tetratricopeptide (TPR) repeat protein